MYQRQILETLKHIQAEYSEPYATEKIPILCAGDLFHTWKASPALLTFAIRNLPKGMVCIPGQHDLPYHRYDLMYDSGYGVLVTAKVIRNLAEGHIVSFPYKGFDLVVHGYPWGTVPEGMKLKTGRKSIHIALIHAFCWSSKIKNKLPTALKNKSSNVTSFNLEGFDAVLFGDNHIQFTTEVNGCQILNHGCLIQRSINERNDRPKIGVLYSDKTIELIPFDLLIKDGWLEREETPKVSDTELELSKFLEAAKKLGQSSEDFQKALKSIIKSTNVNSSVESILNQAINDEI